MSYRGKINNGRLQLWGIEQHPQEGDEVVVTNYRFVVVKRKGHSYNPGSRHSMMKSYYPTTMVVYRIVQTTNEGILLLEEAIEWNTRKKEK